MTSAARWTANRRNAAKSTGPKTAAGKAVASQNAWQHGLTARQVACRDEDGADFAAYRAALRAALAPADAVEEDLAERIVLYSWRLRRAVEAERGIIDTALPGDSSFDEKKIASRFLLRPMDMLALSRYEAALDRALGRAHALLERRQARRRGEAVAAPLTVLVEAPGENAKPLAEQANNENCETNPTPELEPLKAAEALLAAPLAGEETRASAAGAPAALPPPAIGSG